MEAERCWERLQAFLRRQYAGRRCACRKSNPGVLMAQAAHELGDKERPGNEVEEAERGNLPAKAI
jgi:hypothetical protein